jgi:hypothetical protein
MEKGPWLYGGGAKLWRSTWPLALISRCVILQSACRPIKCEMALVAAICMRCAKFNLTRCLAGQRQKYGSLLLLLLGIRNKWVAAFE